MSGDVVKTEHAAPMAKDTTEQKPMSSETNAASERREDIAIVLNAASEQLEKAPAPLAFIQGTAFK